MKKILTAVFIVTIVTSGILMAQFNTSPTIEDRWKNVENFTQQQLPESALKEVDIILKEAEQTKNELQIIKALLYKMRLTLDKNPDEAPQLIKSFESFTEKCTNPAEQALLHSLTAELYTKYYQSNQWKLNQRTDIKGYVPEDINEWTKNIYFEKITQHLQLSVNNPALLQKTDVMKFSDLLLTGNDSRLLQPTLFDLLANHRIELLQEIGQASNEKNPLNNEIIFSSVADFLNYRNDTLYKKSVQNQIIETFQQLLLFHFNENNVPALIHTDLQRLKYMRENTEYQKADSLYFNALNVLENNYSDNEDVVEVMVEKANYLLYNTQTADNKKRAYEICVNGIAKFPQYRRINQLKNIQKSILQKNIQINYNNFSSPGVNLNINLTTQNINSLQLKVYRVNATAYKYQVYKQNRKGRNELYRDCQLIETREVKIQKNSNFGEVKTDIKLKTGDYGIYNFVLTDSDVSDKESVYGEFTVTDFAFIDRTNNPKFSNLYVLDRRTGQPQSNVNVAAYTYKWTVNGYKMLSDSTLSYGKTDKNGRFEFPYTINSNYKVFFLSKGKDNYFTSSSGQNYFAHHDYEYKDVKISLFTDRSTYRPGQTVYFKGIAYYSNKSKQKVVSGKKYNVEMYDANGKKTRNMELTSNEFGSFTGQFVLPETGLNGDFRIQVNNFSKSFSVEEYKRPAFEVIVDKPKSEVNFGEQILLNGNVKAYSGYPVANAKVSYRVVRQPNFYCIWMFGASQIQVGQGTTSTNEDGLFSIKFIPEKVKEGDLFGRDQFFNYYITADVTDEKGETQQGFQSVSVGEKSMLISAELNDKINLSEILTIPVKTMNLNGEPQNAKVTYSLYKLENPEEYLENLDEKTDFKTTEKLIDGTFDSKEKNLKLNLNNFSSGRYKFVFQANDSHNRTVKFEKTVVLYSQNDNRPPVKCYEWMVASAADCSVGETAQIRYGTSTKNSFVLYEIKNGNKVFDSRWIKFSNEIKTFKLPFLSDYGNGVTVSFTFLKNEKLFKKEIFIRKKTEQKKLSPFLSVFRNKLLPGENASWTISIPEILGKNTAELLVGMYDASLDAIRLHRWDFNPSYTPDFRYSPSWNVNGLSMDTESTFSNLTFEPVNDFNFNQLNVFGINFFGYSRPIRIRGASSIGKNAERMTDMVGAVTQVDEVVVQENSAPVEHSALKKIEVVPSEKVQLRSDFKETAFFYPQLVSDTDANVKFSFTVPESLTRWNVMMLAHTKDLFFGQGEAQVVTQKDLMVQMNLPRFVRRSDRLVLSAAVVNLTDTVQNATVRFELIDPSTNRTIAITDAKPKSMTLKANSTKSVEWNLTEFSAYDLVICKVVVQTDKFSDGEQKYLPVLPDKVLVTESMPISIRGNETRNFNFVSLIKNSSKVETQNLSFEFSSNPVWYAVQALPVLATPENENALDYFTAYFANSLSAFIANSNPKIAATFDRWKKSGGSSESLLSNLEKNKELKNILLDETPWVMEAKNETEQKQRIALLFDLNMQKNQTQHFLDKLVQLQQADGGFSWFEGMPSNRYITQQIILNLGRLQRLTGITNQESKMINSALYYLDLEIARDYENQKKYNKNFENQMSIDNMQLFYLHLRSEFPNIPVHVSAKEAYRFYTDQSEKYWNSFTLYGKAMTALVAFRNGKIKISNMILKSLRENALTSEESGMYWARNTADYFWNERPIAIQSAIIEAFSEISHDQKETDEMKIWLLKQKQSQRWDSPISTVEAVYALLHQGTDWLSNDKTVSVKIGNINIEPSQVEAGTGYFKVTIPKAELNSETGKVTVSKHDNGIGWGAMYWQYYQDMNKIESKSGALNISKKLFVEKLTDNGKILIPVEQMQLSKGDKVITRLVITADRNFEFVALKDLRASCFEPVQQRSGTIRKENLYYYQTTKDASTQFFFSILPKGTYVFEYELLTNNSGVFSSGIASIQCQYAPEFISHTGGEQIKVVR